MELNAVAAGLLPVGLLIALGALLKKFAIPADAHWEGLNKISFYLLVPALVITTLARVDVASIPMWDTARVLIFSLLPVLAILGAVFLFTPKDRAARAGYTSLFQTATRWNVAVALAVCGEIFGASALTVIALAMLVLMPPVNVLNVALLAHLMSDHRVSVTESAAKVLRNPIIIGCITGFFIALGDIEIWQPVHDAAAALSDAAVACILLIVGAGLRRAGALSMRREMFFSCALKLALMPLCALLLALMFGLRDAVLAGVLIVAAVPTAMNGYVLAREMGGDAPLYANAASLQVLLSFVTLPFWIWLAGKF